MRVNVEPFRLPRWRAWLAPALALLAALAAPAYSLAPATTSASLLVLLMIDLFLPDSAAATSDESQNVVATRATQGRPRWRLVLLSPLDAPALLSPTVQALAGPTFGAVLRRRIALAGALAFAAVGLIGSNTIWWYALFIPAAYLLAAGLAGLARLRAAPSPGALSYAAGLAVLIAAAEQLAELRHTELWVVAAGATAVGDDGLRDFFGRYPFERRRTMIIGLDGVGAGRPTCITREGVFGRSRAEPLLLRLAAAADAADPELDMEPRRYRAGSTCLTRALRRWRGMTIATLDLQGQVPFRYSSDDRPEQIDEQTLEHTLRLLVGLAWQLDNAHEELSHG